MLARAARRLGIEARGVLRNTGRVPLSRQLAALRHGFYGSSLELYDFDTHGFNAYVSDAARARRLGRLNRYPHVLDDKLMFALFARAVGAPTPVVRAVADEGHVTPLDGAGDLRAVLRERGRLVVKPRGGSSGNRVVLVDRLEALEAATSADSVIVTDFVEQHEYAAKIAPESSNSVRILMVRDVETGKSYLPAAAHRFGVRASGFVDNFSHGGLSAPVDIETGTIGAAVAKPVLGQSVTRHERHPETGAPISGVTVPFWKDLLSEVRRLGEAMPGLRYVGWDVLVTPDGFSILEGNNRADVNGLQIHAPLLSDPRVRAFMASNERGSPRARRRS